MLFMSTLSITVCDTGHNDDDVDDVDDDVDA